MRVRLGALLRSNGWRTAGIAAFTLGFVVRLVGFSNSLWLDEFGTLWTIQGSFVDMWRHALAFQGQTPFYYFFPWLVTRLAGESEIALRLPSLISVIGATSVVWLVGRELSGRKAAWFGAALFWWSTPAVAESASARPYALALLATAVAVLGFARVCLRGDRTGRVLWVLGASALVWVHFVQALVLVGLVVGYASFPVLRRRYALRSFIVDAAVISVLCIATLPELMSLWRRSETLSWLDEPLHFLAVLPLLPFLFPVTGNLGIQTLHRKQRALQLSCLLAAVGHIAVLELLFLVSGFNLVAPRYAVIVVVPAAAAAGVALADLKQKDAGILVAAFAVVPALVFAIMFAATGTVTGAGTEDWRCAVSVLSSQISNDDETPVLFRSNFVEGDLVTLGAPVDTTRAPLRSPGHPFPDWIIVELPHRWEAPGWEAYFESQVVPAISDASRFFVLTPTRGIGNDYVDALSAWVGTRWPGVFSSARLGTCHGINLLEFQRGDT